MKVEMSKDHFTTCDNFYLGWECIEPVVMEIRGKAPDYKERVYSQLNEGQKALFTFYIYFNHAKNSLEEFIWWSNHYYSQPELWAELKSGLRYLNLTNFEIFVKKFEDMREELVEMKSPSDGIDTYCTLFFIFGDHVTSTLEQISYYIKTHPDEFIQFQE